MYFGWWFVWVPGIIWYSYRYTDAWMVGAAIAIDGYYGAFFAIPVLSLIVAGAYIIGHAIRPYLYT